MKIIQIGANNGNDITYDFIKDHSNDIELVVLVEPIPFADIQGELFTKYKSINNSHIEKIAITPEEDKQLLTLYFNPNSNYEVSSTSLEHVKIHNKDLNLKSPPLSIEVPCCTINELIEKYNIKDLDYLFIDTEGMDYSIIKSINFNKYSIKNILFEGAHLDGPFKSTKNLLDLYNYFFQLGYKIKVLDDYNNILATKESLNQFNKYFPHENSL